MSSDHESKARTIKQTFQLIEFRCFVESVSEKSRLKLNNDLPIVGLYAIIKIQMRNVGADEYQVAIRKAWYMLANVPYAVAGLNIDKLKLRMIMPEKVVFQAWCEEPERLARICEYDLLLNLHMLGLP